MPIQGGPRTARLVARQRVGVVRSARPSVLPYARARGRGTLDAALRDAPALRKPPPRIIQISANSAEGAPALAIVLLPTLDLSGRSFSVSRRCRLGLLTADETRIL